MADLSAPEGEFRSKSMDVSVEELVPCCGCICFITSCFTEWPDWFGCVGKRIFLCCYDEFVAYKILDENDKKWFHVFKGSFWCAPVKICCQVSLLQYKSFVFCGRLTYYCAYHFRLTCSLCVWTNAALSHFPKMFHCL